VIVEEVTEKEAEEPKEKVGEDLEVKREESTPQGGE